MVITAVSKKTTLTFKQLNAAIAFVKLRFDLVAPSHKQLADLVNSEFNTYLSERDIDLHYDVTIDEDERDMASNAGLAGLIPGTYAYYKQLEASNHAATKNTSADNDKNEGFNYDNIYAHYNNLE